MSENHRYAEREVRISNKQGLHARPVMRFVDLAAKFGSRIRVRRNGKDVDGKSPMEMMLLEATFGTALSVIADGDDAHEAVDALTKLIADKFYED